MMKHYRERGQTLIEVILAIAVVTLVLVTLTSSLVLVTRNKRFSTIDALATKTNQDSLEWLRQQRDTLGWKEFYQTISTAGNSGPTFYCMPVSDLTQNSGSCSGNATIQTQSVTRQLTVTPSGTDTMNAVAIITWIDGGKTHTSQATLVLKEWQ